MKKAVIYARYSSERQTEQSIEGQLRTCYEFAEHEGITVTGEYIDRAISGTTDHRPQFQRLIADAKNLGIDYVIVYKLDRFARNRYDSAIYKAKLKQYGIRLLSAMEKITDSPEGIIMEGLLEAMNEYYSAELSQKIRRGMRENVIKGKTTGGNVALGYCIGADKRLEVVPEQAAIVRKIFEMYAAGGTFVEIITYLNSSGLKTSRGNAFNKNSISRILTNERYIGRYVVKGVEEAAKCPRIVDDELFNTVQRKLSTAQTKHRHRNSHEYILSGVLRCGKCGERMTGTSGTSKQRNVYYYYHCPGKCHGRINAQNLENVVLNTIDEYLQSDKMKSIAKVAFEEYQRQILDTSELDAVRKEIKQIEKQLGNAVKAVLSGFQSETIKNTINELEARKSELLARESHLRCKAPELTLEMFETAVKNLTAMPTAALIDGVISRIDLFENYIIVYFRLFDVDGTDPDKVRIDLTAEGSDNGSSPPPIKTLYAKGLLIVWLPLKVTV